MSRRSSNYVSALNHGVRALASGRLSVRLMLELHRRLLTGVRGSDLFPGELRNDVVWIGSADASLRDATFVPPPPEAVPGCMEELERFLWQEHSMPALVKAGLAHAQFETIHPFFDGNGRVGRQLITLSLCEQGTLQKPVLYLSHYLKARRQFLGVGFAAANRLVERMVERGVLVEITGHARNRRFAYQRYIALFDD